MGMNETMTQSIIAFAVPLIISQLAGNTDTAEGKSSLFGALAKHGQEVDEDVDAIDGNDGLGILGHIFGDKQETFTKTVAKQSGADQNQVTDLLGKIAPLVLGKVAKVSQDDGLDADGVSNLLQSAKKEVNDGSNGMMDSVLTMIGDKDGDGDFDMSDGLSLLQGFMKS